MAEYDIVMEDVTEYDIVMEDVSFTYIEGREPAIEDVNLKVRKGEILLITGPCGAGKTTLCCCLNGLIPHFHLGDFEGKVIVKGVNTEESTIGELSERVGLVFQDPLSQLVCPTVEDEVAFGPENLGLPREEIEGRVKHGLEAVRLQGYEARVPQTLSGGEQQAVTIASIMAMRPEIYVFDEPTSNLDPLGSHRVLSITQDLVRRENKTLILVSHKIGELISLVDRVLVMNEGRIVLDGDPRAIMEKADVLSKMGLAPPHVTLLAQKLSGRGIDIKVNHGFPVTLEEAYEGLVRLLKRTGRRGVKRSRKPPTRAGEPIIEVENLTYVYPEGGVLALNGVSLDVYQGEFTAIVGQNGSGKTTLVKHFNGLLKPTRGTVKVFGKDTKGLTVSGLAERVGYVFQNPDLQLFTNSVRKEASFGPKNLGLPSEEIEKRVEGALEQLGLMDVIDKPPKSLDKGRRQRVALASILSMEPDVLVIDEPTTGQDPRMAREIMDLAKAVNEAGKTVLVITHDMDLVAEYAKRVVVMLDGKVILDAPVREVFQQTETLKRTFLRPPQVTLLAQMLEDRGLPPDVLSVDEMVDEITRLVGD